MARTFTTRYNPMGAKRSRYERATRYAGQPVLIDPAPARTHVQNLLAMGMTGYSIARDAGVCDEVVYRLLTHTYDHIRIRHAEALLAVTFRPNPRQVRVLSIGAARRLRALAAIGWAWRTVAEHHDDLNASTLSTLANDGRPTITWETWAAIHDVYETLSGTPSTGPRHKQMRRTAIEKGWPAPLDWEGHDIDDPRVSVQASAWTPPTRKQIADARAERVAELTAKGHSASEIAAELGVTKRQVVRDRTRAATLVAAA